MEEDRSRNRTLSILRARARERGRENFDNMTVAELRALAKELGFRGYYGLRKAELITFLRENLQVPEPMQNLQPVEQRRTRPSRPTRPPPPPPPLVGPRTVQNISEGSTRVRMVENQTRVKKYKFTGNLNGDVSNLIMNTIRPVVEMRTGVIYSFSCRIYQGSRVVEYHKTLQANGTFTSL